MGCHLWYCWVVPVPSTATGDDNSLVNFAGACAHCLGPRAHDRRHPYLRLVRRLGLGPWHFISCPYPSNLRPKLNCRAEWKLGQFFYDQTNHETMAETSLLEAWCSVFAVLEIRWGPTLTAVEQVKRNVLRVLNYVLSCWNMTCQPLFSMSQASAAFPHLSSQTAANLPAMEGGWYQGAKVICPRCGANRGIHVPGVDGRIPGL